MKTIYFHSLFKFCDSGGLFKKALLTDLLELILSLSLVKTLKLSTFKIYFPKQFLKVLLHLIKNDLGLLGIHLEP